MNNTDETFLREIDPDNAMKAMGFEPMTEEETEKNNTIEKFYSLIREWASSDYSQAKAVIESLKEIAEKNDQLMDEVVLDFCIKHEDECTNFDNFISSFGNIVDDTKLIEKFEDHDKYIAVEKGFSLLMNAAYMGNIDTVVKLLDGGTDVYYKNDDGNTALSLALIQYYSNDGKEEHGDIASEIIKICGGYGMYDGEFHDLIFASQDGNIELVKKLINAGIFLNFQTDNGYTALMEAIIKKHDDIAIKLIEAGADTDLPTNYNKFTPLGWASSQGNIVLVEKFISANTNLNILNDMQHSPLIEAIGREHQEVAIALIDAGANPNIYAIALDEYDEAGSYAKIYTALMLASANGYIDVVQRLLENDGIEVNFQNSDGYTALMWAIENNHEQIAQELIQSGADISLITKDGETVLDMLNKSKNKH